MPEEFENSYVFHPSSTSEEFSRSSSTISNEEEEQDVSLSEPRTSETNSVSNVPSNDNRLCSFSIPYYISRTAIFGVPSPEPPSITEPDSEDDQPMIIGRGDDTLPSEESDEEMTSPVIPPLQSDCWADNTTEVMDGLFSRALAFTDELIRSLPSQTEPPGRLPVAICPPTEPPSSNLSDGGSIHLKIDLKKKTSTSIVQYGEMPSKYRTDNRHGLPSMEMSEAAIRGTLDQVTAHLAFFAGKLMSVMTSAGSSEDTPDSEDYALAFEVFKEEFLAFDEMVTFALERLGPDVAKALGERLKNARSTFWKLDVASFNGGMYHQENYISRVAKDIQRMQGSINSVYT